MYFEREKQAIMQFQVLHYAHNLEDIRISLYVTPYICSDIKEYVTLGIALSCRGVGIKQLQGFTQID